MRTKYETYRLKGNRSEITFPLNDIKLVFLKMTNPDRKVKDQQKERHPPTSTLTLL